MSPADPSSMEDGSVLPDVAAADLIYSSHTSYQRASHVATKQPTVH